MLYLNFMSGHSKWSKIKNQKGANDAKRGAIFTQLARAITIAARDKGGDPAMNFQLKAAITKAKAGNVPKDNIERAIKKGTGEIESDILEEIVYEGYGPGGCAVIVESLTDNRNRTSADVRHIFSKYGGNLGGSGSVGFMFERLGVIRIEKSALEGKNADDVEMEMIECGAEDVRTEEEGILVMTKMADLQAVEECIGKLGYEMESSLEYLPKDTLAFDEGSHAKLEIFLEMMDDHQDVQATSINVDLT